MGKRACIELRLELIVDLENVHFVPDRIGATMRDGSAPAGNAEIAGLQIEMRVSQVLPEGQPVVEFMLELITDLLLLDLLVVVVGIARPELVDLAVQGRDRSDVGVGFVRLRQTVYRESRALVRLPAEGRREEVAVVGNVEISIAAAGEANDAIKEIVVAFADRPAEIEHSLQPVLGAVANADFADRLLGRKLRYLVDEAARRSRTIENGNRALDHLDALQLIGIGAEHPVVDVGLAQSVTKVPDRRDVEPRM